MNTEQIKDLCEEALSITDQYGAQEGLSFLIGEKFCPELQSLKKAQNQLKYLYPGKGPESPPGDRILKLSYALAVDENYREPIQKVRHLKLVIENFAREIKKSFDINDIQDYLSGYPRLGFKQKSPLHEGVDHEIEASFSPDDIFSEAKDILIIEELKKMFL